MSIIYPPPTAKDIKYFHYCMNTDQVFVLLTTGTICVYEFDREKTNETAQLQKIMEPRDIKDSMKGRLQQEITSITFCKTIPPKMDEENINTSYENAEKIQEERTHQESRWAEGLVDRFIVLGLSAGTVIFLQVDEIDLIYARVSVHREAVQRICEVDQKGVFVSVCAATQITVWNFNGQKLRFISQNQICREIRHMKVQN